MTIDIFSSLILVYWVYAFPSALLFWRKASWTAIFPLISFFAGMYLFLHNEDMFSLLSQGLVLTALLSLEVILLKYSIYSEPMIEPHAADE